MSSVRWGFVGSGKMATALIHGMIRAGTATADRISATDPFPSARDALSRETGITTSADNAALARGSDVLVLAVKPQTMQQVLAELKPAISAGHLVISVAAGVPMRAIAGGLGRACRFARIMPNTPALIGEGASGYCLGLNATDDDDTTVQAVAHSVGLAFRVPEHLLDAVTGLSGSGPAFVYTIIEALSDGGVRVGLPREIATALAAQTVLGAAKMVLDTGLHTGTLKDQVTSPGGTTIAGLHALERGGLRAALMNAVEAATQRSAELAALAEKAGGS